jgi:hypothetical protein
MRDYIEIGPVPTDESCEQLGSNYDPVRARRECRVFLRQLRRQFGPEPEGAQLAVKSNAHDFGTYYEVVCWYDENDETAMGYAIRLEEETPCKWDTKAREELS